MIPYARGGPITTSPNGTLVLTRGEVRRLLDLRSCIDAVEEAFRSHGEGRTGPPAMAGVHVGNGGFHTKAGVLDLSRSYFASKTNANFMHNRERYGLPTIQGTIVLHDAENGFPLAIMDSIEISILRTGAATAVAAKYLARPESSIVAVAGCGEQGRVQLRATALVLPITRALVWDIDLERARHLAEELGEELGIDIAVVDHYGRAARASDVCITCTPSESFILRREDVRDGTFVVGVGVDNPHKRELHPALLAAGTVVVDVLEQCVAIGDLHHALDAGVMTALDVHAELGAVVAGHARGRSVAKEITIFDSTGMALQDVAAAAAVYERAVVAGAGHVIDLNS